MNYATIKKHDVANGPGVRVSLFVSGCRHHCKGCFNAETWDFDYGEPYTEAVTEEILKALAPAYIKGFSVLGGEPFEPENQQVLCSVLERIKLAYPNKTIWCYSGYNFESEILAGKLGDWDITQRMINCIDILVDGEFIEALKSPSLRFKGSSNQRIIDVKKSLQTDELVLWDEAEQ